MTTFQFVQVVIVEAQDCEEARRLAEAGHGKKVVARTLLWQSESTLEASYCQPREILDLAWDRYMDLTLPEGSATMYPGVARLPRAHLLHEVGLLSLMFDNAITAYRESVERSG